MSPGHEIARFAATAPRPARHGSAGWERGRPVTGYRGMQEGMRGGVPDDIDKKSMLRTTAIRGIRFQAADVFQFTCAG